MSKKTYHLDDEEIEILNAVESGNIKRSVTADKDIVFAKEAAHNYLAEKESQNIQIELTRDDLFKIKNTAKIRGISYEQLISSALHNFAQDL